MNDENIYLNLGENKVSVKQTSSGFWYVNELSIGSLSIMDGIALMDRAMSETEKILLRFNKEKKSKDEILFRNKNRKSKE